MDTCGKRRGEKKDLFCLEVGTRIRVWDKKKKRQSNSLWGKHCMALQGETSWISPCCLFICSFSLCCKNNSVRITSLLYFDLWQYYDFGWISQYFWLCIHLIVHTVRGKVFFPQFSLVISLWYCCDCLNSDECYLFSSLAGPFHTNAWFENNNKWMPTRPC